MKSSKSDHGSVETVACTASGKEGALAALGDKEKTLGGNSPRAAHRLDGVAIAWSSLCALHCIVPLLLTGTALLSSTHHAHAHRDHGDLQLVLAPVSVVVAGALLGRSYLLQHRDPHPLWILAAAVSLLALGRFVRWSTESTAMALASSGFLALVAAQVVNVVLLRRRGTTCCDQARQPDDQTS